MISRCTYEFNFEKLFLQISPTILIKNYLYATLIIGYTVHSRCLCDSKRILLKVSDNNYRYPLMKNLTKKSKTFAQFAIEYDDPNAHEYGDPNAHIYQILNN